MNKEVNGEDMRQFLAEAQKKIEELKISQAEMEKEISRFREAQDHYRSIVDDAFFGARVGIILLDSQLRVVWASRAIETFFGISVNEIIGKDKRQLVSEKTKAIFDDAREVEQRLVEAYNNKSCVENFECHVLPGPNREERWLEHWSEPIEKGLFCGGRIETYIDVTERVRLYQALKKNEKRLRALSENAQDIIFGLNEKGRIVYVNPVVKEVLGFDYQDIVGSSPTRWARKEDCRFFVELFSHIKRTGGTVKDTLITLLDKKGQEHDFLLSCSAVQTEGGGDDDIAIVGMLKDITEQRQLERQLRQAQKMEALGTLAGGIAHDFNNILGSIIAYSELALIDLPKDCQASKDIHQVLMAADRARDLVSQILSFSRQSEQERMPISIVPIVKETLKFLKASLPSTIRIVQEIESDVGIIEADPTQIHQVLMNLCINAEHAMRENGGVLKIRLENTRIEKERILHVGRLRPGLYAKLTVSDTGHGMDQHVLDRIFDPYFTTKKEGEGTGLGLAVVHGIVSSYGGGIEVRSNVGKGTTFEIYFPASELMEVREERSETSLPTGHESILFVDDEEMLAQAARLMLEKLGYRVTTKTNSLEALELFKAEPHKFDLVITDLTMPNLTGDKLASKILQIRQNLPIILCTGYSSKVKQEKAPDIEISAMLKKPISMKDLATTVRSVLDRDKDGKMA